MDESTDEPRRCVNILKAPGSTDLCDHIVSPFHPLICLFVSLLSLFLFVTLSLPWAFQQHYTSYEMRNDHNGDDICMACIRRISNWTE